VETASHDSIIGIERFFYSISMVYVDVNVENTRICTEELENAEDYVVDVAES
jgi:hypothetical protein